LNHPHIAAIYRLEEADGSRFLVLELVEGLTLADRLKRGQLPIEEALTISKRICEAIEAHEKGIIHRDLKPTNIKVTPDSIVKVLDFGLAKVREAEAQASDLSNSPTLMTARSVPGIILGTAAYMSPEQAKGQEANRTSDVWAFGCVLYEMLTGRPPFEGETVSELFAGILKAEPDWSRLPAETPEHIRRLLRRCLQKDRRIRLRHLGDALIEIEEPQPQIAAAAPPVVPRRRERLGAVLPFVNANADPNIDYVADGIPESIINSLSQLPNLKVMSRSSVFQYKGKDTKPQAGAKDLKVEAVLTGRVSQRGDGLAISVELVNAADNSQIWGQQYNRKLADVFAVQEEIAKEISDKLRLKLTGAERQQLAKRPTENL